MTKERIKKMTTNELRETVDIVAQMILDSGPDDELQEQIDQMQEEISFRIITKARCLK